MSMAPAARAGAPKAVTSSKSPKTFGCWITTAATSGSISLAGALRPPGVSSISGTYPDPRPYVRSVST
jgi:hypothetical protein